MYNDALVLAVRIRNLDPAAAVPGPRFKRNHQPVDRWGGGGASGHAHGPPGHGPRDVDMLTGGHGKDLFVRINVFFYPRPLFPGILHRPEGTAMGCTRPRHATPATHRFTRVISTFGGEHDGFFGVL